jgi:glycosyltransferase involved in cell wall biosynthesis
MSPARALVVLHVEKASGPQHSLEPRLERLRENGTELTFLVPVPGGAATRWAAGFGKVRTGIPGALMLPASPADAAVAVRALRAQQRMIASAVRDTRSEIALVSSPTMLGALRGARRAGAATLLYCGEVLARGGIRGLGGAVVGRLAARNSDAVIAASHVAGRPYRRLGATVTVINPAIPEPPGADELRRRGAAWRADRGLAPDAPVLATLGAITEGRCQHLLVRALTEAPGERWHLAIGGEAYDRPRDRAYAAKLGELIAALRLSDRVHLVGAVDDPWALYAAADVFVNPAQVPEGFGRAPCEALAAGCPVVATRVGGVEEALRDGETALLVDPGSPGALADAVARLLGDAALAERLATAGAADVARRLAPEAGQPAFEAAMEAALASRRARQSSSATRGPV